MISACLTRRRNAGRSQNGNGQRNNDIDGTVFPNSRRGLAALLSDTCIGTSLATRSRKTVKIRSCASIIGSSHFVGTPAIERRPAPKAENPFGFRLQYGGQVRQVRLEIASPPAAHHGLTALASDDP